MFHNNPYYTISSFDFTSYFALNITATMNKKATIITVEQDGTVFNHSGDSYIYF